MALPALTAAVRAFLAEPRYGVLATIGASGTPHLTAIWYELEEDSVLMNTAAGRVKHHNLQRDRRASICIVDGERYVTLSGLATLIDDQAVAQADDLRLARRYDGPEQAAERAPAIALQQRITIRMTITRAHARGFE